MLRLVSLLLALAVLSGCASTPNAQPLTAEAIQAARLADLLTQTAQDRPDRVRAAGTEMAALESALTRPDPQPPMTPQHSPAPAAAPDLTGAQSLMSAVHLASYREYNNLLAGWSSLQAEAPEELGALQGRVSEVDLGERGVFLRLKAGPLDSPAAARSLCAELDATGHWCAPADYTGAPLQLAAD
jgi:hypothetical protein